MIPSIGRIVHYVLKDGPNAGHHRPAIIVRVFDEPAREESHCQLQVFMDGTNDAYENVIWRTSVHQDATKQLGTWHEPERV